ncbi:MAG: HD domain-containing phosphohydrolase [Alphaproteobacteria bacterium]
MKLHGIRSADAPPKRKILFVDDEANILASFKRRLGKNFDISTAGGGEEALEVLKNDGPFAVIISDQRMPGMDGIEFLGEVKKRTPDTVRMMLTGHTDLETAVQAVNEGCIFRFYTKPCPPEVLADALEAGLNQYDLITAERELLERTLAGSVKVFVDVLSLVNPEAFRKAELIRGWVRDVARRMDLSNTWELNIAAMIAPIGMITLPAEITAKLHDGEMLSETEHEIFSRTPEISRNLISNIPRMENISKMIYYQQKGYDGSGFPMDTVSGDDIPLGARILRILNDLAGVTEIPNRAAFGELETRGGIYDPNVLRIVRSCFVDEKILQDGVISEKSVARVLAANLQAGSRLVSNIETEDGLLVLAAGSQISQAQIERLRNLQRVRSIKEPIYIQELPDGTYGNRWSDV